LEVPLPGGVSERQRDAQLAPRASSPSSHLHRPLAPLPIARDSPNSVSRSWENHHASRNFNSTPSNQARQASQNGPKPYSTDLSRHLSEQEVEAGGGSFGEANRHTQGTEPYPSGIYSLLLKLRSRTGKSGLRIEEARLPSPHEDRNSRDLSIGSLLRPTLTDSPIPYSATLPHEKKPNPQSPSSSLNHNLSKKISPSVSTYETTGSLNGPVAMLSNAHIEKECVRLYFQNLHLVHPILDQGTFVSRCEMEIWDPEDPSMSPNPSFLALFNAVLAIGAINAGDDAVFMRDMATVRQTERFAGSDRRAPTYPPLKLAKLFFERAKSNLGDVFETCSLESTQTFLLMVRANFRPDHLSTSDYFRLCSARTH
jgi:hypothetical protein